MCPMLRASPDPPWLGRGRKRPDTFSKTFPTAFSPDVLLRRADYEALAREAGDASDAVQIREAEARVEAGEDGYVPIELTRRRRGAGAHVA